MSDERPARLTSLTEAQRAEAFRRYELLRPPLEEGVPLTRAAAARGLPLRTAQAWLRRYRQHGLAGLARAPRADRGRRRLVPDLRRLVEGLAPRPPPPSIAAVQRQVAVVAERQGWPVPSHSTVSAVMRQLDPALVTLAHAGTKAYRLAFDLLHRREAAGPNELWQADHTQLDLWLHDERGTPVRPWLTVILDDYSRAVAGFGLSFRAPSAVQTALVLRQAIGHKGEPGWSVCGIPDIFYTDHSSDFTSRHLEQVAADLQMRLIFSQAGVPRGRGKIERFFETVTQLFLGAQPGYAPPGNPPVAPTLTLAELASRFHAFVLDDYHHRAHSETGQPPHVRWAAGGFLPRLPESPEQLDLLLLTVAKARQVHRDGIHFLGFRYLDLTLAAYVGEPVTIRYDPQDLAEIRVFHRDAFLCRAVCQEFAGQTIDLHDIIRARNKRRRQLRAQLDERSAVVEFLLAVHRPVPTAAAPDPAPRPVGPRLKRYANE